MGYMSIPSYSELGDIAFGFSVCVLSRYRAV